MKLHDVKVVTVIVARHRKEDLIAFFKRAGITGYTYFEVQGKGTTRLVDEASAEAESVKFKIIVSRIVSVSLMKSLAEEAFPAGHIVVFQQDASVLRPEKFGEKPGESGP